MIRTALFCSPTKRPSTCSLPEAIPCKAKRSIRIFRLSQPWSRLSLPARFGPRCNAPAKSDREVFLAGVWFSTYSTISGPRLAAIIVDLSEDLRNREDLSLNYLLKNTRILMSAVAHEIRNLSGAVLVVHKNLSRIKELESNEDFKALGSLIQSLERVSALELGSSTAQNGEAVELTSVLEEFRILIETSYHESEIEVLWDIQDSLPLVWADRYGLIQVFLNLAKNSHRAMTSTFKKQLRISAREGRGTVVVRFEDTGTGIAAPESLFRPFLRGAESTGLGLYVSRTIMRSLRRRTRLRARLEKAVASPWFCRCELRRRRRQMRETAETAIHILLLDDHALFRESVGRLLATEPGFEVAAPCGTIKEALQVLRQNLERELHCRGEWSRVEDAG